MTPALIESTHAASGGQVNGQAVDGAVTLSPEEHNEMLQRAFQEGACLGEEHGRCGRPARPARLVGRGWPKLGAPKEASGEPAGRGLSQLAFDAGKTESGPLTLTLTLTLGGDTAWRALA